MRIDFVSDVTCPWCAIGFAALRQALERLGGGVQVELHLQPFELNPGMPAEGEDIVHYMARKYGKTAQEVAKRRAEIRERGAEVGFAFGPRTRTWNTFDAHRLLHWAGAEGQAGRQRALKHALLRAYHGQGRNPGAHDVLLEIAAEVGLPADRAREVLTQGLFADEVREAERFWQDAGISSVPAVVVNRRHLISGGQPNAVFEQALRQIASESDGA
jgi:predicted DsbA family dithiol-disulfide isomerase